MAKHSQPKHLTMNSVCSSRRRFVASATTLLVFPIVPRIAHANSIVAVRTWPADDYTRVTLELDQELQSEHFTLDNPHRMVIDLKGLQLNSTLHELVSKVRANDPYIQNVRVGQFSADVVRLVLDLKQPIAPQVFTLKPIGEYKYRLVIDLYPRVARDPLLALQNAADEDPLAAVLDQLAQSQPSVPVPTVTGQSTPPPLTKPASVPKPSEPVPQVSPTRQNRPILVALDPGHGGEDPGAIGPSGVREKDVVLQIAHRLKKLIDAQPNMRAYMTRDKDFFVPLGVRVQKARRVQADLFISIHADAWIKPTARGSSVYALSQNGATSSAASWLAKKENEADLVGGINIGSHNKQVAQVLLDLSTAAQINDSMRIGNGVLGEIGKVNRLHKRQVERAGFAVLKAPDIPSILIETAFISNPTEEKLLSSAGHQDKLARAMLSGIQDYFKNGAALAQRG
ncbi:N-acetylmuramoyl-L-alanine amidase [Paenalcaligenes hominis]|uniref:N-acetylmuramoyl-L-alanine amidase n=1 Tax=Paenalcaligenes hominis TaxID=643674 RepID=UPI0035258D67